MNQPNLDRVLRQVLIVPTIAVLLGAAALYWQIRVTNRTVAQIQAADAGVSETIEIERLMDDQETGLRGYQTTGDPRFLEPYRAAQPQLDEVFDQLQDESASGADQELVSRLQTACDAWRAAFAQPLIATMQAGGQTNDLELNLHGKQLFDATRVRIDALHGDFARRRDAEIAHWHRQVQRLSAALVGLALVIGMVIGLFTRRLLRSVSAAFRESNDALRARADEIFRSEQRLRTTLASIGDGVITCDAEGRVESLNPVAEELTGWSASEAAGQPIQTVFPILSEATHEAGEDPVAKFTDLDRLVGPTNHSVLVRRDGTEIAVEDSGAPIRAQDGSLIGAVMVFRDVTQARRSQAALLANEKLAVAGRLAATIAHEIHNPLDAVSNLLFLMDGQSTPEETANFLELARGEIARVTQISRALLSLYRESRTPVPVGVKEMLESILLLMERRFLDLGVEVETDLPADLVVNGFPAELRQVFTNLLANAAEASSPALEPFPPAGDVPDQPPLVVVRAQACPPGFDREGMRRPAGVLVTIADEGPGIPEEVAEKLFQPFFTTKGERGTGLGLWVCRGIMTKHGGSIDFFSHTEPDLHGTTFEVFMATHPTMNLGS